MPAVDDGQKELEFLINVSRVVDGIGQRLTKTLDILLPQAMHGDPHRRHRTMDHWATSHGSHAILVVYV